MTETRTLNAHGKTDSEDLASQLASKLFHSLAMAYGPFKWAKLPERDCEEIREWIADAMLEAIEFGRGVSR